MHDLASSYVDSGAASVRFGPSIGGECTRLCSARSERCLLVCLPDLICFTWDVNLDGLTCLFTLCRRRSSR